MTAYYNEIDPFAAEWLRQLIAAGHIAPGDVDTRSIEDVTPDDLRGYTQCHFFAGIGVWSYVLRLAGVSDNARVWTGSCPCQPFSAAGKRGGQADERHLWPAWFHLIEECRPPLIFGEQVASKDGLGWLDLVSSDLEGARYACGAEDRCAAGYGAPHVRQRLFFGAYDMRLAASGLAYTEREQRVRGWAGETVHEPGTEQRIKRLRDADRLAEMPRDGRGEERADGGGIGRGDSAQRLAAGHGTGSAPRGLVHRVRSGLEGHRRDGDGSDEPGRVETVAPGSATTAGRVDGLADAGDCAEQSGEPRAVERRLSARSCENAAVRSSPLDGFWRDADWLGCRDGKWRPVEPDTFPLAHGAAARVGRLRGYGNAIVAPVAQAFVTDFLEAMNDVQDH